MATPFLGLQTLGTILNTDEPAVDWIVEGMIPRIGTAFLVSRPGAGKSLFGCHIGACVVTGTPLFGTLTVAQGAVAYLDLDMHRARLTGMRVAAALRGVGLDDAQLAAAPFHIAAHQSSIDLRHEEVRGKVIAELATIDDLALVVFDTFSDLHHGKEQSPDDMTDTVAGIVEIVTRLNCGGLVNHHSRKGSTNELEDVRGASSIVAKADAVFILKTEREDDDNPGKLTLLQRKSRLTEEARPRHITLETNGDLNGDLHAYHFAVTEPSGNRVGGRPADATAEADKIATRLLWQQHDMPKPELVKQLMDVGIAKTTAYRVAGIRYSQNIPKGGGKEVLGMAESPAVQGETGSQNPSADADSQKGSGNSSALSDAACEVVQQVRIEHPDAPPARVDEMSVERLEHRGYTRVAAADAVWDAMGSTGATSNETPVTRDGEPTAEDVAWAKAHIQSGALSLVAADMARVRRLCGDTLDTRTWRSTVCERYGWPAPLPLAAREVR